MRRLRRVLDAFGPAGVAGLGVFIFCLPFYFSALAPAQAEVERRRAAAKRLPVQALPVSAGDAAAELERFYGRFPPLERLHGELEALYGHARASNVQLLQGEYRLESRAGALTAYHVALPVRGSYAQLRQFVGRVLKDMPTASLDALRFERKKAADAQLEAQVRLTIYLRKGI
ncbi:MAG: hypothetical protein ACREUS_01335 [Burkholderiales bacterium]